MPTIQRPPQDLTPFHRLPDPKYVLNSPFQQNTFFPPNPLSTGAIGSQPAIALAEFPVTKHPAAPQPASVACMPSCLEHSFCKNAFDRLKVAENRHCHH